MSLRLARDSKGNPLNLGDNSPFPAIDLVEIVGENFDLPCEDPWIHRDGARGHAYLEGAANGWVEYPEWMDFLDEDSPCHTLKRVERDLYLHWWRQWMGAKRVLDVGCGIGRFVMPFLDRGADVWGIDADLLSLRRCAWHAAGRNGRLDLHHTTVDRLPDVHDLDAVVSAEVLCYVPDVKAAVAGIVDRLRPGGAFLCSVEARWGWAASEDAPADAIDEALNGTGLVDMPGDRWVQTYTEEQLLELLAGAGLDVVLCAPTHYVTDGPLERVMPKELTLQALVDIEDRCREHPIWGKLNRAWTAVAIKPE